eukprot:TRINITY_DN10124_c0_g1_i1.p1 TRINITY_DN10124_c0_g1~~TRINITY_DN10124_c0_g1_i1.p1  ORF type:complete len:370 (-),score=40.83 TRINITY_DN10124_c0_g1_i1:25-1134(-)
MIPLWSVGDGFSSAGIGLLYTLVLLYLMLGIAIHLNKMMESMETMTSLMKKTSVPDPETGKTQVIIAKIWNQTVANMFMVLGSSSPIIFLCIIEIFAGGFSSGDLGPSTVIDSSAFILLVAVGLMISFVPSGQVRKVTKLGTLVLTSVWSLVLYLWLVFTISMCSYGELEIWEALTTLVFFILSLVSITAISALTGNKPKHEAAINEYKANFQLYKLVVEKICIQFPGISDNALLLKVLDCGVCRRPKSWAYYLTQATNKIAGRGVPQLLESSACIDNEIETTTIFNKNGEGVSVTKDSELDKELKTKVDTILLSGNRLGICNSDVWITQFKTWSVLNIRGNTPATLSSIFLPALEVFGSINTSCSFQS